MNQLYLYVALIGIAFVLIAFTRTKPSAASAAPPPEVAKQQERELREALDEFMNELEQENARLIDSFTNLQVEYKQQFAEQERQILGLQGRIAELEARLTKVEQMPPVHEAPTAPATPTAMPTGSTGFAFNEKYARVVELLKQGQTPEQIARFTGIGIGEIQMVIGLIGREES
jgi:small-conductance mechanosensitive channel